MKIENERFSVPWSLGRQVGDFTLLLCRVPQKCGIKSVLRVQHDYLCSFNQWYLSFVALLSSPSTYLRLFTIYKWKPVGTSFVQMVSKNSGMGNSVGIGAYHLHNSFEFTEGVWREAKSWGNANGEHVFRSEISLEIFDYLSRSPENFRNLPITLN